jgi:hypothetical protein
MRPHLGAVDRDLGQRHHPFGNQRRDALRQKPIEHLNVHHPEVRKTVIVQRHPAGDPPICQIVLRKPLKLPRRTHSIDRRIKPQRQQNCGIGRRPPGLAFPRLDGLVLSCLQPIRPNEPRLARHRITSPFQPK